MTRKDNFVQMWESFDYCMKNDIGVHDLYRMHSENFFSLIQFTRLMLEEYPEMINESSRLNVILETDIGEFGFYNGEKVPLDLPMICESEEVELYKPKRGGNKKFYVYVKSDKGNVIKVEFGDPNMKVKINDESARKSFAARHKCHERTDKTKASYWSCRLPKYADMLGLSADSKNVFW